MHRCVYIYDSADIHGCIRNDSKWGTPEFVKLGLLNKLSTRDIALDFGLPFPIGRIYCYYLTMKVDDKHNLATYVCGNFYHGTKISTGILQSMNISSKFKTQKAQTTAYTGGMATHCTACL